MHQLYYYSNPFQCLYLKLHSGNLYKQAGNPVAFVRYPWANLTIFCFTSFLVPKKARNLGTKQYHVEFKRKRISRKLQSFLDQQFYPGTASKWISSDMTLVFVLINNSQFLSNPLAFSYNFILHQRKAHRKNGHSKEHVNGAKNELCCLLGVVEISSRNNITKPNGTERDEAEIRRLKFIPSLPKTKQHGAAQNVSRDDNHRDGQRNCYLLLVQIIVFIIAVVVHNHWFSSDLLRSVGEFLLRFEGFDVQRDDFDWLAGVVSFHAVWSLWRDLAEFTGPHRRGRRDDFGFVAVPVRFLGHGFDLHDLGFVLLSAAATAAYLGVYKSEYVRQHFADVCQTE